MKNDERCSIKQLAETLGISKDTVLRAIQKGELQAEFGHGPAGAQYWLDLETAHTWWESRKSRKQNPEGEGCSAAQKQAPQEPLQAPASAESPAVLEAQVEVFSLQPAFQTVPIEVHLQALRLVDRAQVHLESLQIELYSTRKTLSSQAESLLNQQVLQQRAEDLARDNAQQKALWEAEKHQLLEELQGHKIRAESLDKKVPRWVRKMFGATGT